MKHIINEHIQRLLSEKQFVEVPVRPSAIARPSVAPSTRVGRYSVETVPTQGRPVAEPPAGLGGAFGFENIGNIAFDVPTNAGSTPAIDKVTPKRSVFKTDTDTLERDFIPGKLPKQQISPFAEPAKPSNLEISLPTDNTSMSVSTIATPSTMSMPTAATTLAPSATSSVAPALMAAAIAVPKISSSVAAFKAAAQNPVKQPQGTPMAKSRPQTNTGTATQTATQTGTPANTPPTTGTGTPDPKDEKRPGPADEIKDNRYPVELLTTKMGSFDPGQVSGVKNAVNAHATKREREEFNLSLDPSRHMTDNQLGHPATRMPFGAYQLTRESTQVSLKNLVKEEIKRRIYK